MAQDITISSTISQVITFLEGYIDVDADGSLRVDRGGLITWLSEQFSYYSNSGDSRQIKDGAAVAITSRLEAVVNREAWQSNPYYPKVGGNTSETARARLRQIQLDCEAEVKKIESPYLEIDAGLNAKIKGIFNSVVAPLYPAGTDRIVESVTYVETFVTDRGEESAPSPASTLVEKDQNDTTTVTCSAPPSGRNITKRRLYRSATGTNSSAFQLHGEVDIATTVITDSKPQEQLAEACPTIGWLEPPAGLKDLTAMPNGIMVGFVGRTLHACEPYHPYAWPAKYDKPLPHDIVGITAFGQSAFVGTTGFPYVLTGSDSASLTEEKITTGVPCASGKSMAAIENAVLYASQRGLALYENGRVDVITDGLFSRKDWLVYKPDTMRAAAFGGVYYAFYTKADSSKGCLVFDMKSRTLADLDQAADAVFANEDGIYILNGTTVYDLLPTAGSNRTGSWYSKTFRLHRPQSMAWLHVDAEYPGSVTVRIYADGTLLQTATVTSKVPVRVKPGKFDEFKLEIEAAIQINGVTMASTTEELKAAL